MQSNAAPENVKLTSEDSVRDNGMISYCSLVLLSSPALWTILPSDELVASLITPNAMVPLRR